VVVPDDVLLTKHDVLLSTEPTVAAGAPLVVRAWYSADAQQFVREAVRASLLHRPRSAPPHGPRM